MKSIKTISFRFALTVIRLSSEKYDSGFTSSDARMIGDGKYALYKMLELGWVDVVKDGNNQSRVYAFSEKGYLAASQIEKLITNALGGLDEKA